MMSMIEIKFEDNLVFSLMPGIAIGNHQYQGQTPPKDS